VGVIHTLIRHDVDRRLISDETLSNAQMALKKLVNDYGQDYWKELYEETEMWYEQRSNDNKSNSSQRASELTFMLNRLIADKENSIGDPVHILMVLVIARELVANHGHIEVLDLAERIVKSLPDPIPPQLLLSAQPKVELTMIESGYDRPANFSYAAHWCKRLITDYNQYFHDTLKSVLDDAEKRGYTVNTLHSPNIY